MNSRRSGLGRGLDALLPEERPGGLVEVEVDRIRPNPLQPRERVDETALQELAASVREHGVLQPVIVTHEGDDRYTLIAGERRWRAARLAGLSTIPALVKEVTSRERLELALVENIQRAELTPLEEAAAYRQLMEEHGLTQEEVARRVGKSRVAVANTVRLLHLPPEASAALAQGAITEGHARAILSCADSGEQRALLQAILRDGLSVRQAEEWVRRSPRSRGRRRSGSESSDYNTTRALEEAFRRALGTKVQLFRSRRGGKLVIYFFSDEELEGLYDLIVGREEAESP
ncbi:MAG TPA: ParB/RepB/Spo0J family partition protein [Chloroflexota bacterium]